ncbi:uncharacterized protein V6R79_000456 [Siganus canaliculatus]
MMIGGLSALILLGIIYQTVEVPQRISTTVAELGGNVILTCATSDQGSNVYMWHKMTLGNVPQTVATVTLYQTTITEPNEQRFTVAKEKDHYVLTIQNVNKDDEGIYFCQSGTSFYQTFTNGIFVDIRGNVPESGSKLDPVVLVLGALLFCCVTAIVVLSYFIKRLKRCALHEGESASLPPGHHKTTEDQPSDRDNDALNYAALNFTTRKLKKEERKKRKLPEECVYSVVRADYHNNQQPSLHIDQDL